MGYEGISYLLHVGKLSPQRTGIARHRAIRAGPFGDCTQHFLFSVLGMFHGSRRPRTKFYFFPFLYLFFHVSFFFPLSVFSDSSFIFHSYFIFVFLVQKMFENSKHFAFSKMCSFFHKMFQYCKIQKLIKVQKVQILFTSLKNVLKFQKQIVLLEKWYKFKKGYVSNYVHKLIKCAHF